MRQITGLLIAAAAGALAGCAGAPLTAEQVAASHTADARRLCEAQRAQDREACVRSWFNSLMRGSPADAAPRQAVSDMEDAMTTCRRLGFAEEHPGNQQCVLREFAAAREARERFAAAAMAFGAGLQGMAPPRAFMAAPSYQAPVMPALPPCPVPYGMGQVGQSGQRGQGANCY